MTKQKYYLFFGLIIAGLALYYLRAQDSVAPLAQNPSALPEEVEVSVSERQVMNEQKQITNRAPASVKLANRPSPQWKTILTENLKTQSSNLKSIEIIKEKSLVWERDSNSLLVESVLIKLTSKENNYSTFRALVDSQTGKILETWDRPIYEPHRAHDEFHFKLDPVYTR